jgi:hypothetical protein
MLRMQEDLELVHVIRPFRLIDSESYEHVYWRRDGVALAPGYYVVSWPRRARDRRFNEDAEFRGPFRARAQAHEWLAYRSLRRNALRGAPGAAAQEAR